MELPRREKQAVMQVYISNNTSSEDYIDIISFHAEKKRKDVLKRAR